MRSVVIKKSVIEYVLSKEKYSSVISNRIGAFSDSLRKQIFAYKSFYTNSLEKDKLLYIPVNYAKIIPFSFKKYVMKWYKITWEQDVKDTISSIMSETRWEYKIMRAVEKQSSIWYWVIRLRKRDNDIIMENIPAKNYYPSFDWLSIWWDIRDIPEHTIMSIIDDESDMTKKVAQVDHYFKVWDKRYWQYSKHSISKNWRWKIEYNEWNLIWEVIEESLDHLPIFIFNNDVNNDEDESKEWNTMSNDYLWDSDLQWCMEILQEINDRVTQVSVELIKNMASKMSIPESHAKLIINQAKEWNLDPNALPSFERWSHAQWENPPQYITKDWSYVTIAREHIKDMINHLSAVSDIPPSFFWLDTDWTNEKVWALNKKMERFYMRCEDKRVAIKSELERLFWVMVYYKNGTYSEIKVQFEELNIYDFSSLSTSITQLLDAQLISQKTAIQKLYWITSEEADEEIKEIQKNINITQASTWSFLSSIT